MGEPENVVTYRIPPAIVVDVLDAPPTPWIALSPDARWMLFVEHAAMPALLDVARPFLRLAAARVDPTTDARHQTVFGTGIVLRPLDGTRERRVDLPAGRRVSSIRWSHDSRSFACLLVGGEGTELWTAHVDSAALVLRATRVNAVLTGGFEWMPDGLRVLVALVPSDRGAWPVAEPLPRGPKVLEARGERTPLRTHQDLLTCEHDERTFEHAARAELAVVDLSTGALERFGPARLLVDFDASPDGGWVLVTTIERPFSYSHPYSGFPQSIECWSVDGARRVSIARVPTRDNVPIEGVRTGPRHVVWSAHGGARLAWLEALDGGDPRVKVPHRDRWMELDAPFEDAPREFLRLEHRASGLTWLPDPECVLARDYDRERRWTRLRLFARGAEPERARTLDDRSARDRYGDPGSILLEPAARGRRVARVRAGRIFRIGDGDSPTGPRPFLDAQDLVSLATERLFECGAGELEFPSALVEDESGHVGALVTRHESPHSPPNLRLRRLGRTEFDPLTHFADSAPCLREITKEIVEYQRADGLRLSGTLYLPPGHRRGERLPLVVWAYPQDYVDPGTASQITASPHHFTRISGPSHLFFTLLGYAVLDGAAMPIVGDPESMNDTFVEQSVSSARAAIEHLDALGVADPARVGIGGHSYGAFLTACLLAHSDLFRAGIARSGAYNRTLTPFGFQAERRTLWEAPSSYVKLSPLFDAHRIRAPLLIVHGEEDENPGTHYAQSERLFQAIKGTGGTARFVSLPREGHGYRARESILHVLAEQIEWFERHVRGGASPSLM